MEGAGQLENIRAATHSALTDIPHISRLSVLFHNLLAFAVYPLLFVCLFVVGLGVQFYFNCSSFCLTVKEGLPCLNRVNNTSLISKVLFD